MFLGATYPSCIICTFEVVLRSGNNCAMQDFVFLVDVSARSITQKCVHFIVYGHVVWTSFSIRAVISVLSTPKLHHYKTYHLTGSSRKNIVISIFLNILILFLTMYILHFWGDLAYISAKTVTVALNGSEVVLADVSAESHLQICIIGIT